MRLALLVALQLVAPAAWAQTSAPSATVATSASPNPTHAELVDQYPVRLADRPRGVGASIFEAAWQGGWQFNTHQGFGEVPNVRYGVTDNFEVNLLGARYVIAEDGQNVPGIALRAQLHDLAYQAHDFAALNDTPYTYPVLRPGGFIEGRDRLPFHLTLDGSVGMWFGLYTSSGSSGAPLTSAQRIEGPYVPLELDLQWSPLDHLSVAASGGYFVDTSIPAFVTVTRSQGFLNVAAIWTQSSRLDVKIFYAEHFFADTRLGNVPELGAEAAVRL